MITIKKIIIIFIAVSIIITFSILFVYSNRDFTGLNGEIIIMQGYRTLQLPLIKYDPKKAKKLEIMDTFYDAQYNLNNGNNLIAVIDKDGQQEVYEMAGYHGTSFIKQQLLYTGKDIRYPKFVPGKNAISFMEENKLTYYDLSAKKSTIIAEDILPQYDWLDSDTVLFTTMSNDNMFNIMAYRISDSKTYVFKENASSPSISYNKKFLSYQLGNVRNTVYIEKINGNDHKSVTVNATGILPFKPSPDGNYLLAAMYNNGHEADIVIINTTNNKMRKIIPCIFPAVWDWKE